MKHCNTCSTNKPVDAFHVRRASLDGRSPRCRDCCKEYDRARANDPHRVALRRQYIRSADGIAVRKSITKKYRASHPEKYLATNAVNNAIRDGRLVKEPCEVCGSTHRIHGHHEDYTKQLEVTWLCQVHHQQRHKELDNAPI